MNKGDVKFYITTTQLKGSWARAELTVAGYKVHELTSSAGFLRARLMAEAWAQMAVTDEGEA